MLHNLQYVCCSMQEGGGEGVYTFINVSLYIYVCVCIIIFRGHPGGLMVNSGNTTSPLGFCGIRSNQSATKELQGYVFHALTQIEFITC